MTAAKTEREWDAVVVGAGPAGALTARQLAKAGLSVLLVDKKPFPRSKVCGACVNGRAISALEVAGLGHIVQGADCLPLAELEILAQGRRLGVPLENGVSISREDFDSTMVREAISVGACFVDRCPAQVGHLTNDGAWRIVTLRHQETVRARVVICADGLQHSSLAGESQFESQVQAGSLVGMGATFYDDGYELLEGVVRMVVTEPGYVGIVRLSQRRLNVAMAVKPAALRKSAGPGLLMSQLLSQAGVAVPGKHSDAHWQGTIALTRRTNSIAQPRLFVVGDATGYVEPFTGEGIAWALGSALDVAPLASACIDAEITPTQAAFRWETLHATNVRRRQRWCSRVAWLLRSPLRVRLAMIAASHAPGVAQWLVRQINAPVTNPPSAAPRTLPSLEAT